MCAYLIPFEGVLQYIQILLVLKFTQQSYRSVYVYSKFDSRVRPACCSIPKDYVVTLVIHQVAHIMFLVTWTEYPFYLSYPFVIRGLNDPTVQSSYHYLNVDGNHVAFTILSHSEFIYVAHINQHRQNIWNCCQPLMG